ncbi:helicase domino isoform X1 [Neodiprion lecontei]|uniref:Helicase domino isoform X1 n=1 Tax=Neodiprion lecontei TaxID=441921 RepID=A0ABM3G5D3_NEOLC|nr:helicase domino isoform X1 [Neodiprion lecontei]XP_046595484.1 helicase domino isoform X1 [Neodiprion lecontei]
MSDKQTAASLPPLVGGGGNNGSSSQQTVRLQQVLANAQGLNVLTTGGGQQFVITSQVPGLAQVIPGTITTNAGVQQVGVTRIVNISSTSPRVSVVGVAGASNSPLPSPTRKSPAKVVLSTSPKLVRTTTPNVFVTPTSQSSVQSPPVRKRLRLTESTEKATTVEDSLGYRRRIMEHKMTRMRAIREKYAENASELFFLHAGGNMMDFQNWRKQPFTAQYLHFLRQHRLDPEDDDEDLTVPLPAVISDVPTSSLTTSFVAAASSSQGTEVKIPGAGVTPVAVSTTLPAAVAQLSQQGQVPGRPQGGRHGMVFAIRPAVQNPPATTHPSPTSTIAPTFIIGGTPIVPDPPKSSPVQSSPVAERIPTAGTSNKTPKVTTSLTSSQPVVKLVKLPASTVVSSCDMTNNQEQIVEKAKQEAYVMQRISELQREGLWSERRLPKVQEPSRTKAHWDYLLEEMVWLAADFAQERKWKKAAAKKCARMVQKHFQEKAVQAQKAEKSHELRLKKIAGFVAKEIKTFWTNVEKLVEYKQQTRLEEKRKKALDQHLNFIVGQTEKYSTWLTEGLNKAEGAPSVSASMNSSRISSPITAGKHYSDDEFEPNQSSDDDEETIAKAEEEMKSTTNHVEEVEMLKRESELPLEDLLKELPPNYLEERDKSLSPGPNEAVGNDSNSMDGDEEFIAASDESSDYEDTIMEQEKLELNQDHKQELNDLKAENEMSIDELMAKYGNLPDAPMDVDIESDGESSKDSVKDEEEEEDRVEDSEVESESEDETKDEDSQTQSDDETNVGLKSLLEDLSVEKSPNDKSIAESMDKSDQARNEMDDVAALAESIQPKGNTLLTTSVVTKIPFLLKHSLREYQHIGLDWLVTMFERKLNGILADEMGLGKTIQTIALLAHLACEKGNWGPHLIIVPTSVMLNWEMECKKWCPGFKILTYYGTQKERKQKRTGWTKPNAFHICITSYKLVIQDHQSFRRKKWKYLILDEAQNIKNFKSQRWQLLLNFQTQRRLLLTGTPLQNNLMELWSLMHFLMPNVFQSHREFKEWFSNPVTGMIEGNSEYNENIIRRLHKVLRPFLLRRLKTEVEKQLPKKYEHVVMCRLSKRQRYLYDDFMSRAKTRETLASGNLLSVINVLMQLRKVCNHPNLFEVRPTVSPFQMEGINYVTASLAWSALDYDPFKHVDLSCLNLFLIDLELTLTAFVAHRSRQLRTPRKLIEEIDTQPDPPPRCPSGKIKINVRLSNQSKTSTNTNTNATPQQQPAPPAKLKGLTGLLPTPKVGTSPLIKTLNNQTPSGQGVTLRVASGQELQGYSVQLVQHQGSVKAIPVATLAHTLQTTVNSIPTTATMNPQRITVGNANIKDGIQRLATQTVTVKQGDSVQRIAVPSFAQLVQTSTGRHIILTSNQQNTNTVSFPVMTSNGQRLTVLSKSLMGLTTSVSTVNRVMSGVVTTTTPATSGKPIMRVPPLNVTTSIPQTTPGTQQVQQQPLRCGIVTRNCQSTAGKNQIKEIPKSEFHLPQLDEERRQRRQAKLQAIANVNERRCAACPFYGEDLFDALRIAKPAKNCCWHSEGWLNCNNTHKNPRTRREYFSRTEALAEAIKSTELIVQQLQEVFERFVVYVPAVRAPMPKFHVSHPPPHKLWGQQRLQIELQRELSPKLALFHPVASAMFTQFPDPRLIQYDCGKLQSLDKLLRKLKSGGHRVLIFTQMTRMLDVLEAFLNFHGHIYLRLDGATKVDQRQVLMERFNGDKRIFCFILSTRSGGVGVNLTGADTVIFYDSDWNPTMDAQAQDRCHRIGQTRDVHIYRLVSEKTVEENILKKANQKRLLGDLAIEGGNFTTAYFKSSTIQDLFNVDQAENDASARMADVLERTKERDKISQRELLASTTQPASAQPLEDKAAMGALESALAAAEEDLDVQAAKTAKAEAVADLAEFDENIPLDEVEKEDTQISKAEQEVQHLVQQLSPIERYAMKFVEESEGSFSAAQLAAAERELEQQKKEWELGRLRALREEEERRMRLADDDEKPLTFGREDAQNQVNSTSNSKKLAIKKTPASRRSLRKRGNRGIRESSESEPETTTSESESQEDQLEDSPDEESSHTESQSQEDEDEDEGDEEEEEDDGGGGGGGGGDRRSKSKSNGSSRNKSKSGRSSDKNKWDLNSPRTRSRGDVKINLWTLDVKPLLPGVKPVSSTRPPRKRGKSGSDDVIMPPPPPDALSKKISNSPTSIFHRRPDTPLPIAGKKVVNLELKTQNKRTGSNNSRVRKVENHESLNSKGVSIKSNTSNIASKFSSRDSNGLGKTAERQRQPVESSLVIDIKSDPLNDIKDYTKSQTDESVNATSDNSIEVERVKSSSPSLLSSVESGNDGESEIPDLKDYSPRESRKKCCKKSDARISSENEDTEETANDSISVEFQNCSDKKTVLLRKKFRTAPNKAAGYMSSESCNVNSTIRSYNSVHKLNSDSDSQVCGSSRSKNSHSFLPFVKLTNSLCSSRPEFGLVENSISKSRSISPTPVATETCNTSSSHILKKTVLNSSAESSKIRSIDNQETTDTSDSKNLPKSSDHDLQGVKSGTVIHKSNLNSTVKSRIARPDTPFPGVTTRNKSSTVNAYLKVQQMPPDMAIVLRPNTPPMSGIETRRITRSGATQYSSGSNVNSNLQTGINKPVTKIGRAHRPDTPLPTSDLGRVTRSGSSRPITPSPQKQTQKIVKNAILPDFKVPDNSQVSDLDQSNESIKSVESSSSSKSSTSSGRESVRLSKRSSNHKPEEEFQIPTECVRRTRRFQQSLNTDSEKFIIHKRRPDTPLPVSSRSFRVTRSTVNSESSPRSSICEFSSGIRTRATRQSGVDLSAVDSSLSNHRLDVVSVNVETSDTSINSGPSSSTQPTGHLSPKLKANLTKRLSNILGTKAFCEKSSISNTDTNANAVDARLKSRYGVPVVDLSDCQPSGKSLRKTIPSNSVKPDSTTKTLDNDGKSCSISKKDKVDGTDSKKSTYYPSVTLERDVSRKTRESSEIRSSSNRFSLSLNHRSQQLMPASKHRLGDMKSLKSSNTLESRATDDGYLSKSATLHRSNTYSNSYSSKAFVRVSKLKSSEGRISITSSSSLEQSSESIITNSNDTEEFSHPDTLSLDSSDVDMYSKIVKSSHSVSDDTAHDSDSETSERQSLACADSTVLTYIRKIPGSNDFEYIPPPKKYRKKKRVNRIASVMPKTLLSNKSGQIEVAEIIDEEDKSRFRFGNRSTHHLTIKPMPPPSSEKSNNSPVS